MTVAIFMKVEGASGESKDAAHKDWTDVESFTWGVTQPHSMASGGGAGADGGAAGGAASFVGCRLTKSADQTISNATFTAISFNGEDFDTDGFHDNVTNNTRITIPSGKGGKYLFTVSGYFADNATGTRTTALYKNGSLIPKARCIWRREGLAISAVLSLVATDYIELFVYQDSGGNLDVNDATSIQASLLGA